MTALLVVDIQNDFLPGGALAVKDGGLVIPVINRLLQKPFNVIVASKDWHPKDHGSFASIHKKQPGEHILLEGLDQVLWPDHCIQNTHGAAFPKELQTRFDQVFYKGVDKNIDSYSAFFDNGHQKSTGLHEYLQSRGIKKLYVAGLATDYCVKYSVMDAVRLGYEVYVIEDACKGVNLKEGDVTRALQEIGKLAHLIQEKASQDHHFSSE